MCPQFGTGSAPFVYTLNTTAIATSSGMYSNHIVITFLQSMLVVTYDDGGNNANIFFLISDPTTYDLSLVNMRTSQSDNDHNHVVVYFSNYASYIIELNVIQLSFYLIWADN